MYLSFVVMQSTFHLPSRAFLQHLEDAKKRKKKPFLQKRTKKILSFVERHTETKKYMRRERDSTNHSASFMKIHFAQVGQPNFTVDDVDASNTVAQLKARLGTLRGVESSRIRLIFRGQPIADETLLSAVPGLSDDTTMHMLVRAAAAAAPTAPAADAAAGSDDQQQQQSAASALGGLPPQFQNLFANLSSGLAGAAGAGGGAGGLPPQLSQLLGGVFGGLGGLQNAFQQPGQQTATTNIPLRPVQPQPQQETHQQQRPSPQDGPHFQSQLPRTTTTRTVVTPVEIISINTTTTSSSNPAVAAAAAAGSAAAAAAQQHQQQYLHRPSRSSGRSSSHNANNGLPQAMIHLHVTPDQLEGLPAQLDRFYERISERTRAAATGASATSEDGAERVHVEIHQTPAPVASGIGAAGDAAANAINGLLAQLGGVMSSVAAAAGGTSNIQPQQQTARQERAADATTTAPLSSSAASLSSQAALTLPAETPSLSERVIQASRETVSAVGVPHFLPLLGGDWSPLNAFQLPFADAMTAPYRVAFPAATPDQIRAAVFAEFMAIAQGTIFRADNENPVHRALMDELRRVAPDAAADGGQGSRIFQSIVDIVTNSARDGIALTLSARDTNTAAASAVNRTFGARARVLAVNASGLIVGQLRQRGIDGGAALDDEAIKRVLMQIASASVPLMQSINPMLAMMVPLQGPPTILRWAEEAPITFAEPPAAPVSTASASAATQQRAVVSNDADDDDLDAFLDDALDDLVCGTSSKNPTAAGGNNANDDDDDAALSPSIHSLRDTLNKVEGLPKDSVDQIVSDAAKATKPNK